MVINGHDLIELEPIIGMKGRKHTEHGVSYGLGEAGYDVRIKQEITFNENSNGQWVRRIDRNVEPPHYSSYDGRFIIASTIEEFDMPATLMGIVHDKSTWARKGLSVFNTVIEPGWKGFLTLELVFKGSGELIIPAGSGIAQVVFHQLSQPALYSGKYQNQENKPVNAISS